MNTLREAEEARREAARLVLKALRNPLLLASRRARNDVFELARRWDLSAADLLDAARNWSGA